MDPLKDFKRTRIPFGKPSPIQLDVSETLLNDYGKIRAVVDRGVITIQTKKLKDDTREVARIDLNASPITIEFAIEEVPAS
jgi:hypothetical protein